MLGKLGLYTGLSGFPQAVVFGMGYVLGYGYANPDRHKGWQVFPSLSQRKYVYITKHRVNKENEERFIFHWKNLARFSQQQSGYLYTHLLQAKDWDSSNYQYINVTTWLTCSDQRSAMNKPVASRLIKRLLVYSKEKAYRSTLHKVMVDDSEYVPPITGA
eukprot:GHVS01037127.1.p1 GENE.GHVS01037127.1~~GHVS01037127.1.p1  ORF type:complete len:160 (+),score=25.09 GHVS01037127.1:71-550(+)